MPATRSILLNFFNVINIDSEWLERINPAKPCLKNDLIDREAVRNL
jgi:hypothetical protein